MHKVTGHGAPKRGKLRRITIEHAANGFSISGEHAPHPESGEYGPRASEDPPTVFQKGQRGAAHKHIKGMMAQIHPEDDQMEPGLPPTGQQS